MKLRPFRNLSGKGAQPLLALLPMAVPYGLHIDPANVCNFRCAFCPTSDRELLDSVDRSRGRMEWALFEKLMDDLQSMCSDSGKKVGRLQLYKDGEPFLNSHMGDMMRLAVCSGVAYSVETTTNGASLDSRRIGEVLESGLNVLRVSVEHVNDDGYRKVTGTRTSFDKIRSGVEALWKAKKAAGSPLIVHCKILDAGMKKEELDLFLKHFGEIADSLNIDRPMGWSHSELKDFTLGIGAEVGMDGRTKVNDFRICPEPFSKLAVNFDGSVSICCVDWSHETVVGDLRKESLSEIWGGKKLKAFRKMHADGKRRKNKACASCQYMRGFPEYSRLDGQEDELNRIYEFRS